MSIPPKNEDPPPYEVAINKNYNPGPTCASTSLPCVPPTTVVVANSIRQYGPDPQDTICPFCNSRVKTMVKTVPTSSTHISALLLCCVCWPCVCLPYFIDSCQNINHYCPKCEEFLGTYGNTA